MNLYDNIHVITHNQFAYLESLCIDIFYFTSVYMCMVYAAVKIMAFPHYMIVISLNLPFAFHPFADMRFFKNVNLIFKPRIYIGPCYWMFLTLFNRGQPIRGSGNDAAPDSMK